LKTSTSSRANDDIVGPSIDRRRVKNTASRMRADAAGDD